MVDRLAGVVPDARVTTCISWSERELAGLLTEGRLDFALAGTCGSAPPPGAEGLVWQEVAVDPVFVMVPEGHALAGAGEVDLAELAGAEWACVPGDGCFGDCFTVACARAGFTPLRMYETDTSSLVHLVQVGRAVGLCRATFHQPINPLLQNYGLTLKTTGGDDDDPPGEEEPGGTWSAGTVYRAGDTVTYGGTTYRCLQGHQAQPGWQPPNVPAPWQRV